MQQVGDIMTLLGYLLLIAAVIIAVVMYFPLPKPEAPAAPTPAQAPPKPEKTPAEWGELADAAEGYPSGHARRVAELSLRLADMVGLAPGARRSLELAALLHDVGEIGLEPALLQKPGPLNRTELFKVWEHAALGARKTLQITQDPAAAQWVRWHHEQWDGLGYPDGLAGAAIPLPARILRLADSADAMLNARPYRGALPPETVLSEINRLSAVSFDPDLARIFVDDVLPPYLAELEGLWK